MKSFLDLLAGAVLIVTCGSCVVAAVYGLYALFHISQVGFVIVVFAVVFLWAFERRLNA